MALHRITFHEQSGYTVTCRVRALVDWPTLLDLAVQKIWGPGHYWAWVPGSATEGRVYQQLYDDRGPEDVPRTECATVAITQVRRGRMPECLRD